MREARNDVRQIVGAIMLVLACLLTTVALFATIVPIWIDLPRRNHETTDRIILGNGGVYLELSQRETRDARGDLPKPWKRSFLGFTTEKSFGKGDVTTTAGVPYWSILIPLSLISALLLLCKPRNPTIAPNADLASVSH